MFSNGKVHRTFLFSTVNINCTFHDFNSYVFGSCLDLHSGGVDLLFPHHENEEAQCCAFHQEQQWATHWMHTGLLRYFIL